MITAKLGVQLYSVRDDAAKDLAGVLKSIRAMGYDGVDFAGYYGHNAETIAAMLADTGLGVAGAHVGIDTLLGDELERSIEFHKSIGNKYLVVPGLPPAYTESAEAWRRTADLLNEIAERLAPHGMLTGYHNHMTEWNPLDGEIPWRLLMERTRPEVIMQFDTGNALAGGVDPVAEMRHCAPRAVTVHIKEHALSGQPAMIGQGDVQWGPVLDAIDEAGVCEWLTIEQESYCGSPMKSIEGSLQGLKQLLAARG